MKIKSGDMSLFLEKRSVEIMKNMVRAVKSAKLIKYSGKTTKVMSNQSPCTESLESKR